MSPSHPRQPPAQDAARTGSRATSADPRPLPDFQPHNPSPYTPIDREIERSERASAALAATRALARASFTDSQLAAEEATGHDFSGNDDVASSWARTEYVEFDPTPQGDAGHEPAPRHLVGGSFNPGIASRQGRLFPGTSIAQAPIRTRSGAMARFAQESRHAPRGESGSVARSVRAPTTPNYEKPAVMPMLAPARPPVAPRARAARRSSDPGAGRFLIAAVFGAAVAVAGGSVAWKAGLLSKPGEVALVTPRVAAQAEAARLLAQAHDEIPLEPAAGPPRQRSDAEVDAALAAAARAAAVPADSVRAASPPPAASPAASGATAHASGARPAVRAAQDNVDAAVANARARADRFLAPSAGGIAPPGPQPEPAPGH